MSTEDDIEDSAAPLIEHLTELRTRLIHSVVAFIVGMIICFTVWNPIFDFLTHPLCGALAERGQSDCGLILIKLQEGFFCCDLDLADGRFDFILSLPQLSDVALCGARTLQIGKRCVFAVYAGFAVYVFSGRELCVLCCDTSGI
jgi:hypothetical protein